MSTINWNKLHGRNFTENQRAALRELRRLVSLETFSMGCSKGPFKSGDEATEYIREATRLYRDTWIMPILNALLEDK